MSFKFTDDNFEETVLKKEGIAVVDFWASWCGPCIQIAPTIEALSEDDAEGVVVGKLDVDDNPETPASFGVRGIPTILFFKNGRVVDRQVGLTTRSRLQDKLNAVLKM